ncbi:DNA topoisomerase I [Stygiolobus caldivivus]|uniref:DNA topoisomerase n=1 Tax=Stygiolobus caldivivus TaxID=2824673 RepID=A0A8D5ZK07_9CREN|nr:DNA topoisomerase I [Stygiolobus caldivivus]BCU71221.1 DNA topoisomerase III [Stygiolobus caldivivus]
MVCKPKEYTLIIAEKSKAAKKIAEALSTKPQVCKQFSVTYWVVNYDRNQLIIAPAAGHLFNLHGNSGFPVFSMEWKPLWYIDSSSRYTKKYYELFKALSSSAKEFVNACDFDIEGSVIGYIIIKFFGDEKKAKRMKFSALTREDIRRAFAHLEPLDYNMISAGIARHKVDWLWGINVSRALMNAIKEVTSKKVVLSAGRVQSPTLIHVVNTTVDRETYVPLPYYTISVEAVINKRKIKFTLDKVFESKEEAQKFAEKIRSDQIIVKEVNYEERNLIRPPPFNLGDLQVEAGRVLGLSPYYTERLAEELYLDGLISYPRTNSQKIPATVNIDQIVQELEKNNFASLVKTVKNITKKERGFKVRQGEKEDPAHPAIYPTGEKAKGLQLKTYKLYELIVRRFLASISADARVKDQHVVLAFKNTEFKAKLSFQKVEFKGWLLVYPYRKVTDEEFLDTKEGEIGRITKVSVSMKMSKPSQGRLTKIDLLKWMESSNLGTEATRGRIIETLFDRKYLEKKGTYIVPTYLGITVAEVLDQYFNELTDISLTKKMEEKLNAIIDGKAKEQEVIDDTVKMLEQYLDKYQEVKKPIGEKLGGVLGLVRYTQCKVCRLEATGSNGLCKYHETALKKLRESLTVWKERSGLSETVIIKKISASSSTGKYVKEIIQKGWIQ